jgi:hypothetical protein
MILKKISNFLSKDELNLVWYEITNNPRWQYWKRTAGKDLYYNPEEEKYIWRYRPYLTNIHISQQDSSTWFTNQPDWRSTVSPVWVTIVEKTLKEYGENFQLIKFIVNGLSKNMDDLMHRDLDYNADIEGLGESAVIYLNPEWKKEWGGQLRYFDHDKNVIEEIYPEPGMLISHTGDCWHQPLGPTIDTLRVSFACSGSYKT